MKPFKEKCKELNIEKQIYDMQQEILLRMINTNWIEWINKVK